MARSSAKHLESIDGWTACGIRITRSRITRRGTTSNVTRERNEATCLRCSRHAAAIDRYRSGS